MSWSEIEDLLKRYDAAKAAYDQELSIVLELGKIGLDQAKLAARARLRAKGIEQPDTLRWRMRFVLGFVPDLEEE